jgi:hypothetical protein
VFSHRLVEFLCEDDLEARLEPWFTLLGLLTLSVATVSSFLFVSHPYKVLGDTIEDQFRNKGKVL